MFVTTYKDVIIVVEPRFVPGRRWAVHCALSHGDGWVRSLAVEAPRGGFGSADLAIAAAVAGARREIDGLDGAGEPACAERA
jgi:hypothetical protein